ncbi:ABC transporter family substrate-binding protein [Streptomyces sp. NPDC001634]|uniref:ABC transporter family substrate-binding protein n=1 Tax=Streptomyces sp. NPDC001634 TaxID=3154390 RepID=UPI003328C5A6
MSHDGVGPRAVLRSVAFLTAGTLAVPVLAACSSDEKENKPVAVQDIAPAARTFVADGGTLRWAVDALPETLNTFQSDADAATSRIAGAVLPSMFRLDANGRPQRNADFLESAKVVSTEPRQVVVYRLDQQAVWSNGREIGADDFAAQWRALSGKDSAYWTARNAGYDRIEKIERGANNLEVKVTFSKPYADWRSLFSPLYPKDVTGTPAGFNDGARRQLKVTAGPFSVQKVDHKGGDVTLTRNPRWWGRPTKLSEIVFVAVPRDQRATALADGKVDMAEVDPEDAERITLAAHGGNGPAAGAPGTEEQSLLRGFVIRKSLEPAYTQLALNGSRGPLADERVRRAVARALDRNELAGLVLRPLGLPVVPVGSHLALSGQPAYEDNSGVLGRQDTAQAQQLLTEAGWVPGGPVKEEKKAEKKAEKKEEKKKKTAGSEGHRAGSEDGSGDDGTYIVGEDNKPAAQQDPRDHSTRHRGQHDEQAGRPVDGGFRQEHGPHGGAPGAYAPKGTAAPGPAAAGVLAKDGKPLVLRFVLPSGPDSGALRTVGDRIARMLEKIGIRTEITKVRDADYFKDHIASGDYDLALYTWPATAFPATDARPIYAKPVPAADGSLSVGQNYTRVGTDQVDQLFDQAIATLDEDEERDLVRRADARIWAAAGSIPLYQRPQLMATRPNLANAGAFGFQTPVYEDMGFLKKGAKPSPSPSS